MTVIGSEEGGQNRDPLSLLERPKDATEVGGRIVVLDASPPWLRIFDLQGNYHGHLVREGSGPNEAVQPSGIARGPTPGTILFSDSRGIRIIDLDAEQGVLLPRQTGYVRALGTGCGKNVFAYVERRLSSSDGSGPSGDLVRITEGGEPSRIAEVTVDLRVLSSRRYHPGFMRGHRDGVLLYPEENQESRLLWVSCGGDETRSVSLLPLGEGERHEFVNAGEFVRISPPEPPLPAGLGAIGDWILWVSQRIAEDGTADSITIVEAHGPENQRMTLAVDGWFRLLDSSEEQILIFTNVWDRGVWGLVPEIYLVDGDVFLDAMEVVTP